MADQVIEQPTYLEHIRHFFEEVDLAHMAKIGIDLTTYESLRLRAASVHLRTMPPTATMPPDPERHWSAERSETFGNWVRTGCPLGQPTVQPPTTATTDRVRKDAAALDADEIARLATAFTGIMERGVDDPQGYFVLAGTHWFPAPNECLHHEDRFNPWHRAYLRHFEDALRSVPGCEHVTLPFWDITTTPPAFLEAPPFSRYTLPQEVHSDYPEGYTTSRFTADEIADQVIARDIAGTIAHASRQPLWGDFITFTGQGIEAAHDAGHPSCGETLATPDVASFDPLFWFFHANWDRLWWEWQQRMGATTLATFRSTITGSTLFLDPGFNVLPPFPETSDQTIDLTATGVSYGPPATPPLESVEMVDRARFGSLRAIEAPRLPAAPLASVRLKGIDRLSIPGTFDAVLRADGAVVGRRTFFQSTSPVDCEACREKAKIDLDFIVDVDQVLGTELTTTIELARPAPEFGATVPLSVCGDPTLNVRLLVVRPT
ncbi:MAG TPA: tyrosinase family protein [Iamia sp.]|nr:tyrosinase family protein [Iamia sp.]